MMHAVAHDLSGATEVGALIGRLRDLARSIERRDSLADELAVDGWAIELWDALDGLHQQRRTLASALRRIADVAESGSGEELRSEVRVLLEQISYCEREETELFLRAFWLDLGTMD